MNTGDANAPIQPLVGDRLRETFGEDPPKGTVAVVDGHGVRLSVDRGQLRALDGVADAVRERSWSKATHGLSRVAVIASTGDLSIPALRWCQGTGVGLVVVDPFDGAVLATSAHTSNNDPRIRRAQALALGTGVGLDVARFLIGRKLAGQAQVARRSLGRSGEADTIDHLAGDLQQCESIDEVRQVEAVVANVYFSAWRDLDVPFIQRDMTRVPAEWQRFVGRRSAVNPGKARSATDPLNAMANLGYRLLEAEARLACLAVGLDVGLGVMHADVKGRDSMVLDVMEPLRPAVDRYILELLKRHPLSKAEFSEDTRGVVRVRAPLTHELAQAMPTWGRALGEVVEAVADLFATSSPYDVSVPSVLTRSKHREAARRRSEATSVAPARGRGPNPGGIAPTRKGRQRPSTVDTKAKPRCRTCGMPVPMEIDRETPRGNYCPACLTERRQEIGVMIHAESQVRARATSRSEATSTRRSAANAEHRLAQQRWELEHEGETFERDRFVTEILPGLRGVSLTAIAKATGMSTSAASKIRAGKRVPHPRRWEALARLIRGAPLDPV